MYRIFILFFCTLIALSSCNIESVTTINADGSGYAKNVIIMDDELKGMMEMMGAMEEGENPFLEVSEESSSGAFSTDDLFTEMFQGDTTMTFTEIFLEDSIELSQESMDLLSQMSIALKRGEMSINYHYKSSEEANKLFHFLENMESLGGNEMIDLDKIDIPDFMNHDTKNGVLRVLDNPFTSGDFNSTFDGEEELDEMTKMMFADSKITSVYVLPGKVEFLNIPNAVIDGNKVTITYDLLESMKKDAMPELVIKYKP